MPEATDALLDLERKRCAAIASSDGGALRGLLADDYVHVHMTGKVDDREGHIAGILARPRTPERGEIRVRIYGDLAVLTGEQINTSTASDGSVRKAVAYCQQVAVRSDGHWRFVSFQLTPKS